MNKMQRLSIIKVAILISAVMPLLASAVKPLVDDLFSAMDGLEALIQTKQEVMSELKSVIKKEENKIAQLQRIYSTFNEEQEKMNDNLHKYLGNPLNAFMIIKRLTEDLEKIESIVNASIDNLNDVQLWKRNCIYPTKEDLSGASVALKRLIDTYDINITENNNGKMLDKQFGYLTTEDYYIIAEGLYNEGEYLNSAEIMLEALQKFQAGDNNYKFTEIDILKKIEFSFYQIGLIEEAKHFLFKLLNLDPTNIEYISSLNHYNRILKAEEQLFKDHENKVPTNGLNVSNASSESTWPSSADEKWKKVCQGDVVELPAHITKKLTCKYTHNNKPHLMIAPFKEEQMYHDPEIFLYYDIISDEEIKLMQSLARGQLERAMVIDGENGVKASYRISKAAWLDDAVHPKVAELSHRISDLTGLTMDTAEPIQIGNYGIGGHYEAHHDYIADPNGMGMDKYGQRIATLMLYMSDVEAGGGTAFPHLGVLVRPQKGAAILWRNLHSSCELDPRTLHGACPVLLGSKWVANKWIGQKGQEFLSPCPLHRYDSNNTKDLPIPVKKQQVD